MAGTETIIMLAKVLLLCVCVYKSDSFHQRFNGVDDADVHTEKGWSFLTHLTAFLVHYNPGTTPKSEEAFRGSKVPNIHLL